MPLIVEDLMTPCPYTVPAEVSVRRVLQLLHAHNLRHLPVVNVASEVVGIISERDLLDRGLTHLHGAPGDEARHDLRASDVMTSPLHTVSASTPLEQAGTMMMLNQYSALPVTTAGRIVGILTTTDFVRWLSEHAPTLKPDGTQGPMAPSQWSM